MKKIIIFLSITLLISIFTNTYANEKGHLFIIGGGKRPGYLMKEFVNLAGGSSANIVVIPVASSQPLDVALFQKHQLEHKGAKKVDFIIFNNKSADADSNISVLDNATGIFFSGGDQRRLAKNLLNTKLLDKIKDIYNNGGVIGGTSAGAAVMSKIMITGDELKNSDSTRSFYSIKKENIAVSEGFGFVENAIIDQHFIKRKRQNRLISLILENHKLLGIGIDESTAIIVKPDKTFEVLGENTILVYDAANIGKVEVDKNDNYSVSGLIMHILKSGDKFNIGLRQVVK